MYIIKDGEKKYDLINTGRYSYKYNVEYQDVKDNKKLKLRVGDIIRIPDKLYYGKDTRNELAVILNKYRKIKTSGFGTFIDYGSEYIIITGKDKGKIKKKLCLPSYTKYVQLGEQPWE